MRENEAIARDGELELAPLTTGHTREAGLLALHQPAQPPSSALMPFLKVVLSGVFWGSCESGKKLVKNRL